MNGIHEEILAANQRYVAGFGGKCHLSGRPAKHFAVLTCMDARLDPAKFAGLAEGDAVIIRNAGGRASDDAIRSLVIAGKFLGAREWLVIHHTKCGMNGISQEEVGRLLAESLGPAELGPEGWKNSDHEPGCCEGRFVNWLTFSDLTQSVIEDVERIRNHPLTSKKISIRGFIYDCGNGKLTEVPEAARPGCGN